MIYQLDHDFNVFNYRALYHDNTEYTDNQADFEKDLLEQLKMREEQIAIEEEREPNEVVLPEITYEVVSLTTEQQKRFDEIKVIEDITLDEVRKYTIDNIEPKNANYIITKLKSEDLNNKEAIADLYMFQLGGM